MLDTELFGAGICDNLVWIAFKNLLDPVHGCELSQGWVSWIAYKGFRTLDLNL